jgi:hypothetical protein
MLRRLPARPLFFVSLSAALAVLLVTVLSSGSALAASGNIRVNPASQTVAALNTNFNVTLTQNADVLTTGAQASFTFDKTRLQIQTIALGAAYGGGTPTAGNTIANANTTGTLTAIAGFVTPPTTIPTGDQTFVTITLQAITCGKSNITLSGLEMIDQNGDNIPVTGTNGTATGVSAVDFNPAGGDGVQDWVTPTGDPDCDGFTTTSENFSGTDANQRCAADHTSNNEALPDRWPVDFNDDARANVLDVSQYSSAFNATGPNPPYNVRLDFNGDNKINVLDVSRFSPVFNKVCF